METLFPILGESCFLLSTADFKAAARRLTVFVCVVPGEQKKVYPDRVPYEEEEAVKDAAIKKLVKEVGTEVERTEGRGIVRVGGDDGWLHKCVDSPLRFKADLFAISQCFWENV